MKPETTPVKVGRRLCGLIFKLSDGSEIYLAHRRVADIYRGGERTIADAIQKQLACWAIEENLLVRMRGQGMKFAGVLVGDTGDRYIAPIEFFFDHTKAKVLDFAKRNGSTQRFLLLHEFTRRPGKIVKRR
jgi:hypothetical protein